MKRLLASTLILLSILFVIMIASTMVHRESMEPGDWSCNGAIGAVEIIGEYPGVHNNKINAASQDAFMDDDLPMKPSIYNKLSWGWSGLGNNIGK